MWGYLGVSGNRSSGQNRKVVPVVEATASTTGLHLAKIHGGTEGLGIPLSLNLFPISGMNDES